MRTYAKRRNRTANQNVLNKITVDDHTSRKRLHYLEPEERQTKRIKLVGVSTLQVSFFFDFLIRFPRQRPAMFGTFETPHPTLEASSQVYKLPSTKPIPSPTPFSPVPARSKSRSNVPTTSGELKENAGIRKRIRQRQS